MWPLTEKYFKMILHNIRMSNVEPKKEKNWAPLAKAKGLCVPFQPLADSFPFIRKQKLSLPSMQQAHAAFSLSLHFIRIALTHTELIKTDVSKWQKEKTGREKKQTHARRRIARIHRADSHCKM